VKPSWSKASLASGPGRSPKTRQADQVALVEALAQGLHGSLQGGQREFGRDQRDPERVLGQPRQSRDGVGRCRPHHPQAGKGAQAPHQIRVGHIIDQENVTTSRQGLLPPRALPLPARHRSPT
jgi:hypothetical protein